MKRYQEVFFSAKAYFSGFLSDFIGIISDGWVIIEYTDTVWYPQKLLLPYLDFTVNYRTSKQTYCKGSQYTCILA